MSLESKQQKQPDEIWLSTAQFGELATLSPRGAKWVLAQAHSGRAWHTERLTVRTIRGRGGASGQRYEVLLSSLPMSLQTKRERRQPHADLRAAVAEHAALIEEERRTGQRKNRERFNNLPWTQEQREERHAAFTRRPDSIQAKAREKLKAVRRFHSFDGSDVPMKERYALVAREEGKSVDALRNWVGLCKNQRPDDWLVALAPKHPGCQVHAEISRECLDFIEAEFFKLSKPSLKPIYRRAELLAQEHGWTIPGYHAVKKMIQGRPHWFHVLRREGPTAFASLFPSQQRDYSSLRVNEVWCSDGHMADAFVRWPDGSVSRPIIVAFVDARSRVCLGYAIGPTESADLIRLAFKDAAEKARALPDAVYIDNGRGFAGKLLSGGAPTRYRFKIREEDPLGIFLLLTIEIIWALPRWARSKFIESFWRTLAEMDRRFDGAYVGNRPGARPEDCDPKKAVPIEQYRKVIDETLAEYHARPHRGDSMDGRSPRAIYEELLDKTTVRSPTREQLRLCMLAAEQIKLDPADGCIRLLGNRYWTEALSSIPRNVFYTVRFNPQNAAEPVVLLRGDVLLCEAKLIERTGFRDQQAAKDHLRAHRRHLKSLKDQDQAVRDKASAAAWTPAPASDAAVVIPAPKLVRPVRPAKDYSPKNEEPNSIPRDQVRRIFAETYHPKAKTA